MNRIKVIIANWLFKHLFNGITEDDILRYKNGEYQIAGATIDKKLLTGLASEAQSIKDKYAWDLLIKEMKHEANKALYHKSQTNDDMIFAKAMLLAIEIMEHKINELALIK